MPGVVGSAVALSQQQLREAEEVGEPSIGRGGAVQGGE